MATAVMALLGVISEPLLRWRTRVVLALLLHPFHFCTGFTALFFSIVSLQDIVNRVSCSRLIQMVVSSQWGVIISTVVISLGRLAQLLLDHCSWPRHGGRSCCCKAPCTLLSGAIVLVVTVHVLSIATAHLSLPAGFGKRVASICLDFLKSADMFPRQTMGWCIFASIFIALLASAVIIAKLRKRRGLRIIRVMRAGNIFRLQPFARPPDDVRPHFLQEVIGHPAAVPPEAEVNVNGNTVIVDETDDTLQRTGSGGTGHRKSGHTGPDNSEPLHARSLQGESVREAGAADVQANRMANNHRDFYDDEQRRHRVQSPPPLPPPPPDPIIQEPNVHDPPLPGPDGDDDDDGDDEDAAGVNNADGNNVRRFVLPDAYLELIFPHRESDKNKRRFSYTKVKHTREISFDMRRRGDRRVELTAVRANAIDQVICLSNILYIISYTPLASYLLFTKGDPVYPFIDTSFQPFLVLLLLKASLDSFFYFISFQMLQ